MFPEYRDLITRLKHNDRHFTQLFEKHNELDQKIKDKDSEITDHLKQNAKLKEKVIALLKQVESNSHMKKLESEQQEQLKESLASPGYNNIQFLEIMRHCEQVNEKYLRLQSEFAEVKNKAGVYVLNILEALPEKFRQDFYPEGIDLVVAIKNARDKLQPAGALV